MNRELIRTPRFVRAFRRFLKRHSKLADDVETALELLRADAFDSRLKTHKLKGELEDHWACSAGYDVRILFEFVDVDGIEAILLFSIGTCDDVY